MIGIEAIQIYFPKTFVDQSQLQNFDGVSKGKYTVGLGQLQLSFAYPCEDINSICLTAVANLLKNHGVRPEQIGRLQVGTETLVDKSKSTKTVLMDLFQKNPDIQGATSINACYGGTNALLNALNWMTSQSWDGRYAIVVAADIAVYEKGPARCTGGAGAIAMLIGPNGKITFGKERSSFMKNTYDFYKPNLASQYPVVDGKISIDCYLNALENCYKGLKAKRNQANLVDQTDFFCFHSPFYKMVQKAFAKLVQIENPSLTTEQISSKFLSQVHPCMLLSQRLGNIYTGSLYSTLISLLLTNPEISNKNVLMFSYGSGLCSTLFQAKIVENIISQKQRNQILHKLNNRIRISPEEYDRVMLEKQKSFGKFVGKVKIDHNKIDQNTYYLSEIDQKWRRKYALKSVNLQLEANQISSFNAMERLERIDKAIKRDTDKFYKLPVQDRIEAVNQKVGQNKIDAKMLLKGGLKISEADSMIENVIGVLSLPLAVIPQIKINNKSFMVPMCIEQPSVVAACSSISKFISSSSTFSAISTPSIMIGQVHLPQISQSDLDLIELKKEKMIQILNEMCASMIKRGGGVKRIQVRRIDPDCVLEIFVNVCDAMGANIVNTLCQKAKECIQGLGINAGIAILSNYCTERKALGWFQVPISQMARKQISGEEVVAKILQAQRFAKNDQHRATTHNKGIMNGIDAVCLAFGQDWRAVEAAAHSYASRTGKYLPLSHYQIVQKNGTRYFKGSLQLPISVGSKGGVLEKNPIYKTALDIAGNPSSKVLSEIMVCIGLSQNLAALRALAIEGIQKGHMSLHVRTLAKLEGVPDEMMEDVCKYLTSIKKYDREAIRKYISLQFNQRSTL